MHSDFYSAWFKEFQRQFISEFLSESENFRIDSEFTLNQYWKPKFLWIFSDSVLILYER